MPKPNKYAGNGKLRPEGTQEGLYVMNKGRMVPMFRAAPEAIERGINAYKAFKGRNFMKLIARITLGILLVAMVAALMTGCQVNVVNVVHSDIGVQGITETIHEVAK
ncbi:hypothetical protein X917_gp04 [Pseudomonas phage PPpW-4]|uniref:Uncharacterized protein n=1 Tax=Pseudomonas phage PPpW-4 TaxID=1279083 RepID=V5YSX5_9CAUD|nr:hypothetical protein X917_gp04 [Pseudomonas phage PPpW-4]BAO20670.1 hypothetical protein [Pseudomonas phage PPpW-4]